MKYSLPLACLLVMLAAVFVKVMPSSSGVELHEAGKIKVIVEDNELVVLISKPRICQGDLNITYPTTSSNTMCQISGHATDFATMPDDNKRTSLCALQKSPDDVIEVNVVALPSGCTVTLTNAKLPGEAETQSSGASFKNILMIIVIVLLVVLVIVCSFVGGWYYIDTRRKKPSTKKTPVEPADPNSQPISVVKPNKKASKKGKKADVAPTPTPVAKTATPAPTPAPAVPPAPSTTDDLGLDEAKPEITKPHWTDPTGIFSAARALDQFMAIRNRGSVIASRLPGASGKSQKTDSFDEHLLITETAMESLVRHGFLDKFLDKDAVVSRRESSNAPQAFLDMQRFYVAPMKRRVDPREMDLLLTLPQNAFPLADELTRDARKQLAAKGVKFSEDGQGATFTQEARDLVFLESTPAYVAMAALAAEFGYLAPPGTDATAREFLYAQYSTQLLLLIVLRPENEEQARREALAFMMRKIARVLKKHSSEQMQRMAFPLSLAPEAERRKPTFFRDSHLFTCGRSTAPECCPKNEADAPKPSADSTAQPEGDDKNKKEPAKRNSESASTAKTTAES